MQNYYYYLSEVAAITGAAYTPAGQDTVPVQTLLTDSRNFTVADGSLFFALVTARNDGHKYIASLYEKGMRCFVVEYIPKTLENKKDIAWLRVKNTLKALQTLAAHHRQRFNIPVVGITGSNGKTIVKEWLSYLLGDCWATIKKW